MSRSPERGTLPGGRVRRTNAQLDADKLREAADVMEAYKVPASANVLRVVADAIEAGTRVKDKS